MNERIKQIRKALHLSQDDFGKKLGVTRGVITNIELNKTEPKPLFIKLICETFEVNENWVVNGTGEMFIQKSRSDTIADFFADVLKEEDDSFKRRFVEMLASLSVEEWKLLEKKTMLLTKKEEQDFSYSSMYFLINLQMILNFS